VARRIPFYGLKKAHTTGGGVVPGDGKHKGRGDRANAPPYRSSATSLVAQNYISSRRRCAGKIPASDVDAS